jgi:uracil-DNA glycosylase
MDGREQLRRYLEQRREVGETELVLDQLHVDEVMKILGATPGRAPAERGGSASKSGTAPAQAPGASPAPASSDWREVLRSSGMAPEQGTDRRDQRETAASGRSDPGGVPPAPAPGQIAPPGISVGGSGRELSGGSLAQLDSLDAIAKTVASCTRCPLYSTATHPVPGEGNPNADLMVVGEAPGATEDETGRPFVGAAGQLLTKILAAVELRREDVFICNVLKHRPPGNRNPMPDEITACSPYLLRQIELIRPKAILALGTFAAQTLLQTKLAIGKLRSQVHRYYGVPLIVTYHPAALLRNPSWKRPTWEDVQLVRRILDSPIAQP